MNDTLTETLDTYAAKADGTVGVNPKSGLIVYADEKVHELLGYEPRTLMGAKLDTLLPQRIRNDHQRWLSTFMVNRQASQDMSDRTIAARRNNGDMVEANAVIHSIENTGCVFLFTSRARRAALRIQLDSEVSS